MHPSSILIAALGLPKKLPILFNLLKTALTPIYLGGSIFLWPSNDPFLPPIDKSILGKLLRVSALLVGAIVTTILVLMVLSIVPLIITAELSLKFIGYSDNKNISETPKECGDDLEQVQSPHSTSSSSPVSPTPLSLSACDSLPLYRIKLDIVSVHEASIGVNKHSSKFQI